MLRFAARFLTGVHDRVVRFAARLSIPALRTGGGMNFKSVNVLLWLQKSRVNSFKANAHDYNQH